MSAALQCFLNPSFDPCFYFLSCLNSKCKPCSIVGILVCVSFYYTVLWSSHDIPLLTLNLNFTSLCAVVNCLYVLVSLPAIVFTFVLFPRDHLLASYFDSINKPFLLSRMEKVSLVQIRSALQQSEEDRLSDTHTKHFPVIFHDDRPALVK